MQACGWRTHFIRWNYCFWSTRQIMLQPPKRLFPATSTTQTSMAYHPPLPNLHRMMTTQRHLVTEKSAIVQRYRVRNRPTALVCVRPYSSSISEEQLKKEIEEIAEKFSDARELLDDAVSSCLKHSDSCQYLKAVTITVQNCHKVLQLL